MNISLLLYFSTVFCIAIEQKLFENGILPGIDDVLLVQAEQIQWFKPNSGSLSKLVPFSGQIAQ